MFGQKNMLDAPYECYNNKRYIEHSGPMNKDDAKYLLLTLNRVYKEHGINMLLSYGTLLGAVREHDFIPHDYDMDAMIWEKDKDKALGLSSELEKYGIILSCYVLPWVFTYEYKGVTCDIDVLYEAVWPWKKRYCLTHEMYIPKSFFENTKQVEFLGELFTVPAETEKVLEYHYGKTWRIPGGGSGRVESYVFFWRYAHRFMQRCVRYAKKHWLKK